MKRNAHNLLSNVHADADSTAASSSTTASEATSGQQQQQQTLHWTPGGEQTFCQVPQCHEVCPQGLFMNFTPTKFIRHVPGELQPGGGDGQ